MKISFDPALIEFGSYVSSASLLLSTNLPCLIASFISSGEKKGFETH